MFPKPLSYAKGLRENRVPILSLQPFPAPRMNAKTGGFRDLGLHLGFFAFTIGAIPTAFES